MSDLLDDDLGHDRWWVLKEIFDFYLTEFSGGEWILFDDPI